jgi:hypothetical protein
VGRRLMNPCSAWQMLNTRMSAFYLSVCSDFSTTCWMWKLTDSDHVSPDNKLPPSLRRCGDVNFTQEVKSGVVETNERSLQLMNHTCLESRNNSLCHVFHKAVDSFTMCVLCTSQRYRFTQKAEMESLRPFFLT